MILDLKKIQRIKTLSQYLELDETVIKKLAEDETEREISLIIIHQRNKERKVAKVQSNTYKQILKNIAAYLNVQYKTPEYVFGYVKGKSILKNSEQHVGKKYIIKADIKDFFYSIKFDKVKKMFLSFISNDEIATLLSKLVTYDGQLYPGLITSPVNVTIL